jgi:hypothetical protein
MSYMEILGSRHFPTMKTLNYFRNEKTWTVQRKEFMNRTVGPDFPIILTTYSMVVSDKEWFAHYKWKYVVLDEVMEEYMPKIIVLLSFLPFLYTCHLHTSFSRVIR